MTLRRYSLVALPVLACTACVSSGTVTAKAYDPSYPVTTITTIGNCTCYPMTTWEPECWRLDLSDGNRPDADTGSVCVDKTVWDSTLVGEYYRDAS